MFFFGQSVLDALLYTNMAGVVMELGIAAINSMNRIISVNLHSRTNKIQWT